MVHHPDGHEIEISSKKEGVENSDLVYKNESLTKDSSYADDALEQSIRGFNENHNYPEAKNSDAVEEAKEELGRAEKYAKDEFGEKLNNKNDGVLVSMVDWVDKNIEPTIETRTALQAELPDAEGDLITPENRLSSMNGETVPDGKVSEGNNTTQSWKT
ncbi:hypothetical protein KAI58_04695 [Candidatus Gracilibacteria bacterium]|nr:hypothetical protein [Candidatus Gracilibacteria bacterium]